MPNALIGVCREPELEYHCHCHYHNCHLLSGGGSESSCIVRASVEKRLQILLERSSCGMFRANLYGRLLQVNSPFVHLLGQPSVRDSLLFEIPLYYRARSRAEILERVEQSGRTHAQEVKLERPDGKTLWVSMTETVTLDSHRSPVIDGLLQDISRLRKAQDELTRSNQDLKDFAYLASHQLQEPLRMVDRYTQLLVEDYPLQLDPEAMECLRRAHDGARRMQNLIDDLLALAQVDDPSRSFRRCNVAELIEEALENLRSVIEEKKAEISCIGLPEEVVADSRQLVQLFQNLISNGIKFYGAESIPRIRILASSQNGEWVFSIQDNGIGIDPGELQNIFKLFKRLHPEYPGTGLGLAICHRIVERHGGRIWAESEPGQGSTFYLTLPVTSDV